jgi:hypothetical protein
MDIAAASKLCQEYTGRGFLLEALEDIQCELREHPEDVPWEVRTAYNDLCTGLRVLFAPIEGEVQ